MIWFLEAPQKARFAFADRSVRWNFKAQKPMMQDAFWVVIADWDSKDFEQQCAAWIAELRKRQHFDLRPWYDHFPEWRDQPTIPLDAPWPD
jgi:hypothetical protein